MSLRSLASRSIAVTAAASLLALSLSPASALTIAGPSLAQSVSSTQVDKIWWRGGGWGWRGGGWGWRGGWGYRGWGWRGYGWRSAAVVGGLAAGAVVGSAIVGPGYYGPGGYAGYYSPSDPCWQWAAGAYGRYEWRRIC